MKGPVIYLEDRQIEQGAEIAAPLVGGQLGVPPLPELALHSLLGLELHEPAPVRPNQVLRRIGSAEGGDGLLEGASSPQLRTNLLEHLVGVAFVTEGTTRAQGRGLRIEPHEPPLNPEVEADALPRSALEPTDLSDLARHLQHETMPSCELRCKCYHRRGPRDHGAFRPW